MNDEYIKM